MGESIPRKKVPIAKFGLDIVNNLELNGLLLDLVEGHL